MVSALGAGAPFRASFRLAYVDRASMVETGEVSGVVAGGSVTRNAGQDAKESSSVTVVGDFDPGAQLVRLWADLELADGSRESHALGTFVPTVTSVSWDGSARTVEVDLDGRLCELAADASDGPVTVPAGTPAVAFAAQVARERGFPVLAEASTHALSAPRSYGLDEGDSVLSMLNDLLGAAGFGSCECDPMGALLMRRYVEPADRPVAARWDEGPGSRLMRAATLKTSAADVANVVRAVFATQERTVVGVAVDDSPTSPHSTVSRGRRVVATYRYDEAVGQAEADARAASLLAAQRAVVSTVELSHAFEPLFLGDVIEVDYPSAGVSGRYAVRTMEIGLGPGMPVSVEARSFAR